ncbi:zinc-binding dehydrogenase [Leifsonia sp. NPDC102414]|uniref:zinc-binding dehydrogenase n=1 Tax=Leifsonia sp. NPDC102414 TaxID=3364124 RepID=UPI00381AAF94
MQSRTAARVTSFGDADGVALVDEEMRAPRGTEVAVRITHASLGSTDVLARRGGYVFQPLPGFVTGYDFVGVLETESAVSAVLGMRAGDRVAGVLPRMGAHATSIVIPATLLAPVPDALDSAVAATAPLDLITAWHALQLAAVDAGGSILVQGVTGPVGSYAAQLAQRDGLTVFGSASTRSRAAAEALGVAFVDYTDPLWAARVKNASGGGVDAAIDHTGSQEVLGALAPHGTWVHTAFVGRPGHERADSLLGSLSSAAHRWGGQRQRVCSVPGLVLTRRNDYRRGLTTLLGMLAAGELTPLAVDAIPFDRVWDAHRAAERAERGRKVVVTMPE